MNKGMTVADMFWMSVYFLVIITMMGVFHLDTLSKLNVIEQEVKQLKLER